MTYCVIGTIQSVSHDGARFYMQSRDIALLVNISHIKPTFEIATGMTVYVEGQRIGSYVNATHTSKKNRVSEDPPSSIVSTPRTQSAM